MKDYSHRIGERFKNKEDLGGYEFVIVEYKNRHDLWVEFQDKYKARVHTGYNACQKGEIKNPYHPSVCVVGKLGLMKDGSKPKTTDNGNLTREYALWSHMLRRCYDDKLHEEHPTYKECTVCDRWLIFSNFLEDLPLIEGYEMWLNNPNERIALDKDSKVEGNKIYSLENCKFISGSDNSKERIERYSTRKKVMAISLTENKVIIFQSMHQAEKLGFKNGAICLCCQGKNKQHKGYKWKYI